MSSTYRKYARRHQQSLRAPYKPVTRLQTIAGGVIFAATVAALWTLLALLSV